MKDHLIKIAPVVTLLVLFLTLKLTGVVGFSWLTVFSPVLIPLAIIFACCSVLFITWMVTDIIIDRAR